jgi:dTDP-glucose pyrophosphorylase
MASKQTSQAESGFSKLLDRAQSDSMLAVLVQNLEESLNMALVIASEYMQEEPISVIVSRDFVPIRLHSQQILAYIDLYVKRAISKKLLLEMLEVGDVFDGIADFDIDEEIARVQEDPDLPLIGSSINGKQDSNLTSGSRPSEDAEGGLEFREADTPSTPGG